jgi:rod shape-determining protein MreD
MTEFFVCFLFWLGSLVLETSILSIHDWFHPNLFLLVPIIFCLRWKGPETYFISAIFGLTADCFSSFPFGTYGSVYFCCSFVIRWYAIKIYVDSFLNTTVVVAFFSFVANFSVYFLVAVFFIKSEIEFGWLHKTIIREVLPTAILSHFIFRFLSRIDKTYRIRLVERVF